MAACDYCGTNILFGGTKDGDLRFCGPNCAVYADWVRAAQEVPAAEVERRVKTVHEGACPKCGERGSVDVHTSYRVYSALVFTRWSSHPELCCASCGRKKFLKHGAFSMLLGWWGFPFGLLLTPVQVGRNLAGLMGMGGPDPDIPSPALNRMVRRMIVAEQYSQAASASGSPGASGH